MGLEVLCRDFILGILENESNDYACVRGRVGIYRGNNGIVVYKRIQRMRNFV